MGQSPLSRKTDVESLFDPPRTHLIVCAQTQLFWEVTSMTILETYVQCLKAGDAPRIAALFAEDAVFHDEAPVKMGFDPIIVRGHQTIEDFYRKTFKRGGMDVSNVGINGNSMRYDVVVGKISLLCLGVVTEEKGLIKQYRVIAV
jgi:hypothetical protein